MDKHCEFDLRVNANNFQFFSLPCLFFLVYLLWIWKATGMEATTWKIQGEIRRRRPFVWSYQPTSNSKRRALARNVQFLLIFSGSCIPTNESLIILLALPTLAQTVANWYNISWFIHSKTYTYYHGVRMSPQNSHHILFSQRHMSIQCWPWDIHITITIYRTRVILPLKDFGHVHTSMLTPSASLALRPSFAISIGIYQWPFRSELVSVQNIPYETRELSRNAGTPLELYRCQYRVPRPSA
jgi:hypothetical protein